MEELVSRSLRHRVRVLGDLLGQTMAAQLGDDFLKKVEQIRLLAKTRRQEGQGDFARLREVLIDLDEDQLISIARAFNQFLNLTNIAEQADATENLKFPETSHLKTLFNKLNQLNIDPTKIGDTVKNLHCDLVLTAHPTEITRRTLIQKYNRIAEALADVLENEPLSEKSKVELERLVAEVWHTDEIRTERPTPQDEAIWGYAVIEHSFWHAIPKLWQGLDQLLKEHINTSLPIECAPITISSWMGGDRDGNPNVTTEVTNEVLRLARWMAADLYLRDVEELLSQLSMSNCNEEVTRLCGKGAHEPYRSILRGLRSKLNDTREWAETTDPPHSGLITNRNDLFEPLHTCYRSLHECGMSIIAEGLLKQTLIRVSTFGVTLIDLDIRQSADKHIELMEELISFLGMGSYRSWSEKARHDFLLEELASKRPLIPESWEPEGDAGETLRTIRLIANGDADGVSCYIISMAKNPSDVLSVILLLRKSGLIRSLPIVPLFETLDDLENAAWTLERLLRDRMYRDYIDGHQQVMIGYSDSAKDAGQMAAAWAQYRAQEELVEVTEKYDIDLTLFHGRGGAAGRGGAPIRQAILSQPPNTIKRGMRVTEQGEMIRFKYGSPLLAQNSMDIVLSAAIEANLIPSPKPRDNWRNLMDRLTDVAMREYRDTVKDESDFAEYFCASTPEQELSLLALGSRPTRRNADSTTITDLRAIPWVFAWTQKRLMIPAWLGTNAALATKFSTKDKFVIKEMMSEWPFFQAQMDLLEMVLTKADAEIAQHYDEMLVPENLLYFGARFQQQLTSLIENVNQIKEQHILLEHAPEVRRTIDLRDPYTDPLHFLQIELISRHRMDNSNERVKKALLITIAGIAASMRNTG
ncbi:MAG: phosphoenolpyruvate carboxylase [Gammaproteobacteria bacterium]|jgi:phosphoenolpyruvate carboxylase|nr:phosphoenolpyruvate carboxylase [Gammaproteobacteria bacterium]